jgi:hypothetical protein
MPASPLRVTLLARFEASIPSALAAALSLRWRRFSVQLGGLAKVGSGSDYAASLCSGLALSGASPG